MFTEEESAYAQRSEKASPNEPLSCLEPSEPVARAPGRRDISLLLVEAKSLPHCICCLVGVADEFEHVGHVMTPDIP